MGRKTITRNTFPISNFLRISGVSNHTFYGLPSINASKVMCFVVVCCLVLFVQLCKQRQSPVFTSQHLFLMLSARGLSSKWKSDCAMLGCTGQVAPSIEVGVGYRSNDLIHIIPFCLR